MNKAWLRASCSPFATAAEFTAPGICSIEGEGGADAGGGGAADLLGEGGQGGGQGGQEGQGGGAGAEGAGAASQGTQEGQGGGQGGEPPAWAAGLSAEGLGEGGASNRDYVAAKGFKDPDALVGSYRELEKQLHGGKGYVKMPGEGAKPEEIAAFHRAIGVPEKVEGYEIKLPELGEGEGKLELDTSFVDPMKKAALEAGVPAAAFGKLGDAFVQWQLDQVNETKRANDGERDAVIKEWGAEAAAKTEDFRRGAKLMDLTAAEVAAMQNATLPDGTRLGARFVMEKLASIGGMVGEDVLAGGGKTAFGVASAAEAQAQVDAMLDDKDTAEKIRAKDPATIAKYNRLNDAIAHFQEAERRRR